MAPVRKHFTPLLRTPLPTLDVGMAQKLLKALMVVGAAAYTLLASPDTVRAQSPAVSTNSSPKGAATNTTTVWKLMEDYFAALAKNQLPKAEQLAPQILTHGTNDWNALNFFSWRIFADRNIRHRDRALALAAAQRAFDLMGEKEPAVLDTYARALFETGRHEEAIRHQKRAVELCPEEAKRIDMEANLNRYLRLTKKR